MKKLNVIKGTIVNFAFYNLKDENYNVENILNFYFPGVGEAPLFAHLKILRIKTDDIIAIFKDFDYHYLAGDKEWKRIKCSLKK